MSIKAIIPTPTEVAREGLICLGGILLAAFILSRCPRLRAWVTGQSLTIKDPQGKSLF